MIGRKTVRQGKNNNKTKDLKEELKASQERYRDLFERVRHGIFMSTKEGRFVDCNQAMLEMFGYENKEEFLSVDIEKDLYVYPQQNSMISNLPSPTTKTWLGSSSD